MARWETVDTFQTFCFVYPRHMCSENERYNSYVASGVVWGKCEVKFIYIISFYLFNCESKWMISLRRKTTQTMMMLTYTCNLKDSVNSQDSKLICLCFLSTYLSYLPLLPPDFFNSQFCRATLKNTYTKMQKNSRRMEKCQGSWTALVNILVKLYLNTLIRWHCVLTMFSNWFLHVADL